MTKTDFLKGFGYKEKTKNEVNDREFYLESENISGGGLYSTMAYRGVVATSVYKLFLLDKSYKSSTFETMVLNAYELLEQTELTIESEPDEKGYKVTLTFRKDK